MERAARPGPLVPRPFAEEQAHVQEDLDDGCDHTYKIQAPGLMSDSAVGGARVTRVMEAAARHHLWYHTQVRYHRNIVNHFPPFIDSERRSYAY